MIRRLTSDDADLLRLAYSWDEGRARWYREADNVFNSGPVENLIAQLDDSRKCFVGIWDGDELAAVIIIDCQHEGQFEGHLMAKSNANTTLIQFAIEHLLHELLQFGLEEVYVWIAKRNQGVRKLCSAAGFAPDGVVMYRGAYHNRVIKWLRYSVQREQILMAKAA